MTLREEHLSTLQVDLLGLGALPSEVRAQAQAHLEVCPDCRQRAEALAAHKARFTREVLPRTATLLRARATPRRRWWSWAAVLTPSLAAVGALVLLLAPVPSRPPAEEPLLGVKGGPLLQVYAHRQGRVWRPAEGELLAPGDQLRFRIEAAGWPYLLVVSLDGAGRVSVYFPFGGTRSGPMPSGGSSELPGSVILDSAPGPERLFALFSREPLSVEEAAASLRQVAAGGPGSIRSTLRLSLPAEAQASFLFEKVSP